MARLQIALALLVGALAASCWWGWLMFDHAGHDAQALLEAREDGRITAMGQQAIEDEPAETGVPIYIQTDERWGGLPYAGADLATSGCGLTCAAMAWEYLGGREWNPVQMLNAVGNSCVQDGQNYMPGFCEWMTSQDPSLNFSVLYEGRERAISDLESGRLVFGCMEGLLYEGGRDYGGHIVLLTGINDVAVTVHDPCTAYEVSLDFDAFNVVDWNYFISIGRE